MPNIHTRNRQKPSASDIFSTYLDDCNDELVDAVVTAAALVARADGCVTPTERTALIGALGESGLLAIFTRKEILDAFDRRLRELDENPGAELAINGLERLAGRVTSHLVIDAAGRVAMADGHVDPREAATMRKLRSLLARPHSRNARGQDA